MSLVPEIFCMLVRHDNIAVLLLLLSLGTQNFAQERVKLAEARFGTVTCRRANVGSPRISDTLARRDHYEWKTC